MVAVGLLTLCFALHDDGALREADQTTSTAAKKSAGSRLTKPIDLSATNIGANYLGANLSELYKAFSKIDTKKDEFETTDAYRERVAKAAASVTLGAYKGTDPFATVRAAKTSYDADSKTLTLNPLWFTGSSNSIKKGAVLFFPEPYPVVEPIIGTGAAAPKDFLVVGADDVWDIIGSYVYKCESAEARLLKNDLQLLSICEPVFPYWLDKPMITGRNSVVDGDMNEAGKIYGEMRVLYVKVSQVWLYRLSTGEVLEKWDRTKFRKAKGLS